jgi:hypothetical protein
MSGVPNVKISREVDGERVDGVTRPVFMIRSEVAAQRASNPIQPAP